VIVIPRASPFEINLLDYPSMLTCVLPKQMIGPLIFSGLSEMRLPVCECGVAKTGGIHSAWCPIALKVE
jgi:hypothetical protein